MALNRELQPFLQEWDRQWSSLPPGSGPAGRRAHFETVAANMRLAQPAHVDDASQHWVPSEAGEVRVRVYRHTGGGSQPCLIYMHGGAFMQGSPETHADITSRIAATNRQTVISVDYALAPEHPFPAAVNQCADVVRWVVANATELGIDPHHVIVGGDSAGANLAAVLALIFRQDKAIRLAGQLLIYPPVDFDATRRSYIENADGPLITTASMPAVNAMYCPDPANLAHPHAAPFKAPDHAGLPPAFIAVAEHDPLRDDGIDYAAKLDRAGVDVTLDGGKGLIHGYLRAMCYCEEARKKLDLMCAWLSARNAA